jgi:hypothetical protein
MKQTYEPGTYGYHEALHTLSVLTDALDRHVFQHPALEADREAHKAVWRILALLYCVYVEMADRHIGAEEECRSPASSSRKGSSAKPRKATASRKRGSRKSTGS